MDFGKYIAHRGLHSELVPENSLTAFRLAVEKCLSIEIDVRLRIAALWFSMTMTL